MGLNAKDEQLIIFLGVNAKDEEFVMKALVLVKIKKNNSGSNSCSN